MVSPNQERDNSRLPEEGTPTSDLSAPCTLKAASQNSRHHNKLVDIVKYVQRKHPCVPGIPSGGMDRLQQGAVAHAHNMVSQRGTSDDLAPLDPLDLLSWQENPPQPDSVGQEPRQDPQQQKRQESELNPAPRSFLPLPQLSLEPKASLALSPLVSIRLREPVLALAFDTIGRRLISVEPSRGIRFRSVTHAGDDLSPPTCGCLDWRLWARAICVLPCGHLLVATPSSLHLLRPDGTRVAVRDGRPGIVGLAAHGRSALALDSWKGRLYVFELPSLECRKYHPLHEAQPLEASQPTALCSLRNLAAVARDNEMLLLFEIDTGRLRQSVFVSRRSGPKELASCHLLGLLFVSVFADRCIHIFKLRGGMLDNVGRLRDMGLKPGPLAWLPDSSVLFCAGCQVANARSSELRSFALHEADNINWSPRSIRLMGL